jgi:hypothetical protein
MATVDVIANRSTASEILGKAYFETDTNSFIVYNGIGWVELQSDGTGAAAPFNQYSVDFDGTNDYMVASQNSAINITGSVTLSAWIKLDSLGLFQGIISKRSASGTNYQFYIRNTNVLSFYDGTGVVNDSVALTSGSWIHVAVVVNGSNLTFYRNGSASATGSGVSVSSNTADLTVGEVNGSSFLNGKVDECAVFDTALSASDISAIYNSGVPDDLTSYSPVGWWRMGDNDGGTGTTITDQGSGGNNGTLTNGPTFSSDVPS